MEGTFIATVIDRTSVCTAAACAKPTAGAGAAASMQRHRGLNKKPSCRSLRWPTVLVVSNFEGHPRSMIFM